MERSDRNHRGSEEEFFFLNTFSNGPNAHMLFLQVSELTESVLSGKTGTASYLANRKRYENSSKQLLRLSWGNSLRMNCAMLMALLICACCGFSTRFTK